MTLSVSFKHFGHEVNGATVVLLPFGPESPGIAELGYKTRREAEAIAAQHTALISPNTLPASNPDLTDTGAQAR